MPAERVCMRQVREILRLAAAGLSGLEIVRRAGVALAMARFRSRRRCLRACSIRARRVPRRSPIGDLQTAEGPQNRVIAAMDPRRVVLPTTTINRNY